jgi:hypothetical protein
MNKEIYPTLLEGKYEKTAFLGKGSFGEVILYEY